MFLLEPVFPQSANRNNNTFHISIHYLNHRFPMKKSDPHIPAFYLTLLTLFLEVLFFSFPLSAQDPISLDKVNYIALSPEAAALHDAVNYPVEGNLEC